MALQHFRSVAGYLVGALAVTFAVILTQLIWPPPAVPHKTILIAAVMVGAFYGGLGPALLTTGLATCGLVFVVLPPRDSFFVGADDVLSVVLFLLISILAGVLHDMANRATAAAQRERQVAEAANEAKGRFLAMVSHELRTPLSAVSMAVALLERDPPRPGNDKADLLAMVRRNVEALTRIVDDLLDLVREGTGKLKVTLETVSVQDLLQSVVDLCGDDIRRKQIGLRVERHAERDRVLADPVRLRQVLGNLLGNAVKFTPDGGAITLRTSNDADGRLAVEVIDTGIGIEPDRCNDVFTPFQQGGEHVTKQYGGLGLGLTISKLLAEAQGGSVEIFSAGRGQGTTARVLLPVLPQANEDEGDAAYASEPAAPSHAEGSRA